MNTNRINVTFDKSLIEIFAGIAQKNNKTLSAIVRDFALDSLEKHEDFFLSKLSDDLDSQNVKTYTHEEAWR